jgi:spore germination cell wall hydrolase CwlJ-like protein
MMPPELQRINDIFYLALVTWREARGEGTECMTAVAFSIMNRVKSPKWWGRDITTVVTKKWQYSSMTDPRDRQLTTWPGMDPWWEKALTIAADVYDENVINPVPGADSYFDISIPNPNWAPDDKFVKQIGRIKFYNLDSDIELV